jgi:predicted transposase YdaD
MREILYFCICKEKCIYVCDYLIKPDRQYVHKKRTDMQRNDYLWKGVLEDIFDDFLRFMHPDADEIFDFGRPHPITFLDKELEQLFPPEEDKFSTKVVDKLARLYTRDGLEEWVLIHCEVQGKYDPGFPQRMYTYFCRIFDKYGKHISAYAILTEKTKKARAGSYVAEFLGTRLEYRYNIYKISQQSESELLQSNNPFAMVALTVRSVLEKKRLDDDSLMEIKLKLVRQFLNMSLPKKKIRLIISFLKNYIRFENPEKNIIFEKKYEQLTERKKTMGLEEMLLDIARTDGEKRGIKLGEKRGIEQVVMNMLRKNLTDETIADLANVTVDYVQKMRKSLKKQGFLQEDTLNLILA